MKGSLQIKNGKYYAVFRLDGKQKWVSTKIPATKGNKRKAEKELQKILYEYSQQEISENMLFIDFLDMWLLQIKSISKPVTWETYDKRVNGRIKPYFATKNYELRSLKPMYFTEYFVYLKECGLGKKTITNIRGVLSSALVYAEQNNLIKSNPISCSQIPSFDADVQNEKVVYSSEQSKKLLNYAEETQNKMCLFLHLVLYSGARKGEILALTWDDVDFNNNTIHICKNRTGSRKEVLEQIVTPKSKNGVRTLPLPQKVMCMLQREKDTQQRNKKMLGKEYKQYPYDYVIRQADGQIYNPNSINRIIKRITSKIELPHSTVHGYRHAVASMLFENGVPLADVTTQLGHGQTSTTERIYVHKTNVANVENSRVLEKMLDIT